jgi:VRR-NUC domain protein|nr:MAG TPA: Nuclease [Caudoviricetes sp.]
MQIEALEQCALFEWAEYNSIRLPELKLLYHIPNGGFRNKAEAAHLKRQGVKAGVPDLCLPVARKGYNGLYIELKAGKNKATDNQKSWLLQLSQQGYFTCLCYGWQQAAKTLESYLKGE